MIRQTGAIHDRRFFALTTSAAFETGLFVRRLTQTPFNGRPCLFLDRDGVLVEETNYLHEPDDVAFIPGVADEIAEVNGRGFPVVLVTNQAGIGRGYYDWAAFAEVQEVIFSHLAARGARLDMVLACAFHAEGLGAFAVPDHPWRKPGPGMLYEAARTLEVDLSRSFIVGDTLSDLTAGRAAGLPEGALVLTGHGKREHMEKAEPLFAQWREQGSFEPHVSETAAIAIREWLGRITAPATDW